MLSALLLQVWLVYRSTLDFSYCIADFCLPKCNFPAPESDGELSSAVMGSNVHCFLRFQSPSEPIFFKFSNFNATKSFVQVSWNYRGQEKIDELNSFYIDSASSDWKPIVDQANDTEGQFFLFLMIFGTMCLGQCAYSAPASTKTMY